MSSYFLTSERLGFRTWAADDIACAADLWGDPDVARYSGGVRSSRQIEQWLNQQMLNQQDHGVQYWPMFLLASGEHVGCCGLRPRDAPAGVWELGCHLRRAFWSRGLGREAGAAVITHAFDVLGVHSLFAGHHPANLASQAFLRHVGFEYSHDELYPPSQMIEPCYRLSREGRGTAGQTSP
jgi:[ribosomal protein S5]-alanine N-acetyltransferase